ncbi:hypothetical protein Scep_027461 [Stephania cephalantha]|uniref:Uncharacterized protein n=1 Tax=Stephania cephalantha TaxID=152367 RepID=A0AAP0HIJ0_9MAGN
MMALERRNQNLVSLKSVEGGTWESEKNMMNREKKKKADEKESAPLSEFLLLVIMIMTIDIGL